MIDYLIQESVLGAEQQARLSEHMLRNPDERVEEALLALGIVDEAALLKAMATVYKTNFVSTEKLSKAEIGRATLEMIPRRFAEAVGVFPVVFDQKTHVLSVVTADPENFDALREVQLASGARDVKAIVARPAAVSAAIKKAYGGDAQAFSRIDRVVAGGGGDMASMFYAGHNMLTLDEAPTGTGLVREPS